MAFPLMGFTRVGLTVQGMLDWANRSAKVRLGSRVGCKENIELVRIQGHWPMSKVK